MNLRFVFFFFCIVSSAAYSGEIKSDVIISTYTVPLGGNAYQTKGVSQEKISADGITNWKNSDTEFSIFVKSNVDSRVLLDLDIFAQEGNSEISIDLNGQNQRVEISSGTSGLVSAGELKLIKGYNEIKLQGVEKLGTDFVKIKNIEIKSDDVIVLDYVKDNIDNRFYWGRRGPSVHLSYSLPTDKNFQWFYSEVTVPEGSDPIGSYFMANGFGEGYFGIQVNSEIERRILFSVWSPYKTDNPGEIPDAEKIILLKKGEDVYTGEFGNEGSGGQSYLKYTWKAGKTYSFLNSVTPDGKGNTVYTAYFKDPEVGEWMLIASFLRPKTDTWYKRPHSFLENFVPETGYQERSANYGNQWAADTEGNWQKLTEAKFTGDDIAKRGYRKDFEGGEKAGHFYLRNDGFFNGHVNLNSVHQRKPIGVSPTVNFDKLP
ncbi:uncharacterized protein DUF5077 [Algoriphagus ratkowskyi]|uniref:DUF3472 domain-containing protein n=1 Tax=Algoriphagus ratkowskyi TaxID=57028 RepID=A0A2W7RIH1_9BACT|nr:DUF3472 domain-containing protein [Algoriphagus ratkowskyi]PZX55367.1 uncharacterized protein DUF5077 [Algoriphagus ratkowskyi]TXD79702.1 DUF3472 domain-containing protein [Algoriphagus ratkowskyi]